MPLAKTACHSRPGRRVLSCALVAGSAGIPSGHRMWPLCSLGFMEIFHKILHAAVESHASDIHLKVGHPVAVRINRQLLAVDAPEPSEEWLEKVIAHVVPKHLGPSLEKERETDFSYY